MLIGHCKNYEIWQTSPNVGNGRLDGFDFSVYTWSSLILLIFNRLGMYGFSYSRENHFSSSATTGPSCFQRDCIPSIWASSLVASQRNRNATAPGTGHPSVCPSDATPATDQYCEPMIPYHAKCAEVCPVVG